MKGALLILFQKEYLLKIEDITDFVATQRTRWGMELLVPEERVVTGS